MTQLPEAFEAEMRALFERFDRLDEWPAFMDSFDLEPSLALRANPLKIRPDDLSVLLSDPVLGGQPEPVSWSSDGFYVPAASQPGRQVWHSAGLYYIQEASAMLPAEVLGTKPGERILDLCAAPGGKSCRIASDLGGEGLLIANEISADRARALLHNLERIGCTNAVITNEPPQRLAAAYPGYFDRILVDAPCSGSGMFRRDSQAAASWQAYGSEPCTVMQRDILDAAWIMLRPGGTLVYSTCTFSVSENEAMIAGFLDRCPDAKIEPIDPAPGVSRGLAVRPGLDKTARIWPHLARGDGHFCAKLTKADGQIESVAKTWQDQDTPEAKAAWQAFDDFCDKALTLNAWSRLDSPALRKRRRYARGNCHLLPEDFVVPDKLRLVKTGLYLGRARTLRDKRTKFEPSQAWLYSLKADDLKFTLSGEAQSDLVRGCLRGDTLSAPSSDVPSGRYAAVVVRHGDLAWPLGWCKAMAGGLFKNLYPQAWTRLV